ncbi:MAG: hypothetical protein H5T97_00710 [Firmicutes bacterium]|nr:hypothetical protein [Bacillota bacterium]
MKADHDWRVIGFRPVLPRLSGVGLPVWGKDAEAAEFVFRGYLSLLSQGNYMEAAEFCVGSVRGVQERQAQVLGKAPLFKEVIKVLARLL